MGKKGNGLVISIAQLRELGFDENGNRLPKEQPKPEMKTYAPQLDGSKHKEGAIFIPGEVPSSKNSKGAVPNANGKCIVIDSEPTKVYKTNMVNTYHVNAMQFRAQITNMQPPYQVQMYFARKTRGIWDFHNALQIVADMMQNTGWVGNDNADSLLIYPPLFAPFYEYNPAAPGVYIKAVNYKS